MSILGNADAFSSFVVTAGQMYHVESGAVYHIENIGGEESRADPRAAQRTPTALLALHAGFNAMTDAVLGNTYDLPWIGRHTSSPPVGSSDEQNAVVPAHRAVQASVRTTAGAVRGRWEDGLAVFRGIPFAEPPVGEARFAAPQPVHAWDGVRKALSFGPPPPQDPVLAKGAADLPKGDDWLTVNVWTPNPGPAARRPVMVWIYGGGYELGFSRRL